MIQAIWSQWFPESGYKAATNDGANSLERYGDDFNSQLGLGDIEVWIPCLVTVTNTSLAETAQCKLQGETNE
jgi:predicted transcriptional regulator YdeE